MSQSSSRHTRRAIKAVSRKAAKNIAKGNGIDVSKEVSLDPQVQGMKIAALEQAINRLVEMQGTNHDEIRRAFTLADAHLWVLRQIVKDIVAETVMMASGPVKAVNMEAYYDLFNAFQKKQAEEAAKAEVLKKAGVQAAPETQDEGHEVFGGDLSNEDPEGNEGPEAGQGAGEVADGEGGEADAMPQMQDAGLANAGP